jgi:hypothetical protein
MLTQRTRILCIHVLHKDVHRPQNTLHVTPKKNNKRPAQQQQQQHFHVHVSAATGNRQSGQLTSCSHKEYKDTGIDDQKDNPTEHKTRDQPRSDRKVSATQEPAKQTTTRRHDNNNQH